jgi:profilin-like protein
MSSWDEILEQNVIVDGSCVVAGLANAADCAFYAAAPVANNLGWSGVWSEPHVQQIEVDIDRFENVTVHESVILHQALATGSAPYGLWLGKNKFKLVRFDPEFEVGSKGVRLLFASRPKGGVHVVSTGTTVVIGVYSEERGQTSTNARQAVLRFAEYLISNGY